MGGDPANTGRPPPLPIPPGHVHLSPTRQPLSPAISPNQASPGRKPRPRRRNPSSRYCTQNCCRCCCAWASFVFFFFLFSFTLIGVLLYAWFEPKLPEFRVERLSITRLDVTKPTTTSQQMKYLTANVDLFLEALNKNYRIGFTYDRISVRVLTEDINLSHAVVPGFFQGPNNMTVLRVQARISGSLVDDVQGKRLNKRFKNDNLVLDLELGTKVVAVLGKWHSVGFPITATCSNVDLSRVATGFEPKCKVHLFGW